MINQFLKINLKCPISRARLELSERGDRLLSSTGKSYDIVDGIPIMLTDEVLSQEFDYVRHYAIDADLFDYFEQRTGGTEHDERRVRENVIRMIDSRVHTILDAGCGKAWLAKEMTTQSKHVVSLDVSINNPRKALQLYPSQFHSAVVADACRLPFDDSTFDCVVSSEVIEHSPAPQNMIEELIRVLNPGGKLIVTTPYKENLRYSLCIHCNEKTPINSHIHSFDEIKLRQFSGESGTDFSWSTFGNKALMHIRMHVFLNLLPFGLWKLVDGLFNIIIRKPAHIIAVFNKKGIME
jgi:SAM-dependent methyltransferase